MTIPLDRLYHYVENVAKQTCDDVVIYRFWPHGSKNIQDLSPLNADKTWKDSLISLTITCHDQEPLNWDMYDNLLGLSKLDKILIKHLVPPVKNNICRGKTIYDKSILLHSEKRSAQCEIYQNNNFILAYYWSHAIISLDWFRYAQYVDQKKSDHRKIFLIYNRAWSGTREYRLKFADMLVSQNLVEFCNTKINAVEPELNLHYSQHNFLNQQWRPNHVLEKYFAANKFPSTSSADFDIVDYENSDIEIVLETLFDDDRLHLTEKILRPIACGQPFILAATAGSLQYLRDYGFKTFDSLWDESYDLELDSFSRLNQIVTVMKQISCWDPDTRRKKMQQAQQIVAYNKQHFFSQDFFQLVTNELKQNLKTAIIEANTTNTAESCLTLLQQIISIKNIDKILSEPNLDINPTVDDLLEIIELCNTIKQSKNTSQPE